MLPVPSCAHPLQSVVYPLFLLLSSKSGASAIPMSHFEIA